MEVKVLDQVSVFDGNCLPQPQPDLRGRPVGDDDGPKVSEERGEVSVLARERDCAGLLQLDGTGGGRGHGGAGIGGGLGHGVTLLEATDLHDHRLHLAMLQDDVLLLHLDVFIKFIGKVF